MRWPHGDTMPAAAALRDRIQALLSNTFATSASLWTSICDKEYDLGAPLGFALVVGYYKLLHDYNMRLKLLDKAIEVNCDMAHKDMVERVVRAHPYTPPMYAVYLDYHGQLQTLTQAVVRTFYGMLFTKGWLRYDRETIEGEDGGDFAIDWISLRYSSPSRTSSPTSSSSSAAETKQNDKYSLLSPEQADSDRAQPANIVLIHPGLLNSSDSDYLIQLSYRLCDKGYKVGIIVGRGLGGTKLKTPRHFLPPLGHRTDYEHAIELLRDRYPHADTKIHGLGFSLGAAIILRIMGKQGAECALTSAFVVSPPWCYFTETRVFWLWDKIVGVGLIAYALTHLEYITHNGKIDIWSLLSCRGLREFDTLMSPNYGYENVEHYYNDSTPLNHVHGICVPTLAVSSYDDPLCCITGTADHHQSLSTLKVPYGGHLAFPTLRRRPSSQRSVGLWQSLTDFCTHTWVDDVIADYFDHF